MLFRSSWQQPEQYVDDVDKRQQMFEMAAKQQLQQQAEELKMIKQQQYVNQYNSAFEKAFDSSSFKGNDTQKNLARSFVVSKTQNPTEVGKFMKEYDTIIGKVKEEAKAELAKRSEEHTSELQSHSDLVCRVLLEKKKNKEGLQEISNLNLQAQRVKVHSRNHI